MTPSPISALPLKPAAQERSRTDAFARPLCDECVNSPFEQQLLEASQGEPLPGATASPPTPDSEPEASPRRAEDAENDTAAEATPAYGPPLADEISIEGDASPVGASVIVASESVASKSVASESVADAPAVASEISASEVGSPQRGSESDKAAAAAAAATGSSSDRQGLEPPTPRHPRGVDAAPAAEGSGGHRGATRTPAPAGVAQPAAQPPTLPTPQPPWQSPTPAEPSGQGRGLVDRGGVDSPQLNPSEPPAPLGVAAGSAAGVSHELASRVELPRDTRLAAESGPAGATSADAVRGPSSDMRLSSEGGLSSDRELLAGSGGLPDMKSAPPEGAAGGGEFSDVSGELVAESPPAAAAASPHDVDALPPGAADALAEATVETRGGWTPGAQAASPNARLGLDTPAPQPRTAADQVAAALHRVRDSEGREETRMEIRLDPPELGRVEIVVRLVDDRLSARIVAADEQARQALERDLSELRASLERAGVSLELDIGGGDRPFQRGAEPRSAVSRRRAESGEAPPAEGSPRRAAASGGQGRTIDLIV